MKRRIFTLLLALVMVIGLFPAVSATEIASGTCGENLTWRIDGDTLYIEGQGDMYNFERNNPAPWSEKVFYKLNIGPEVTSLGNEAFRSCETLQSTNLAESHVTRIGKWAFSGTGIIHEVVPEGVTILEEHVFRSTSDLVSLVLPESLLEIHYGAFAFTYLGELTIPASVQYMANYVFEYAPTAVRFVGDAPTFAMFRGEDGDWEVARPGAFCLFKGTIYYPSNNPTWTEDITTVYNGWYTWVPYTPNPFTDVPSGAFYEAPVLWALENGITTGATADTFNPNGHCLRAHVVTFLHRAAGNPEPTVANNPFTDVKTSDFFYAPVLWAVEKGITNGTGAATFGSYDVCNRAAVVTFLWRAAGSPEPESTDNPFTDVESSDFFYKPVLWAIENGITNGVDATHFGPTSPCNRAQVVTFLYRAYN